MKDISTTLTCNGHDIHEELLQAELWGNSHEPRTRRVTPCFLSSKDAPKSRGFCRVHIMSVSFLCFIPRKHGKCNCVFDAKAIQPHSKLKGATQGSQVTVSGSSTNSFTGKAPLFWRLSCPDGVFQECSAWIMVLYGVVAFARNGGMTRWRIVTVSHFQLVSCHC